jgi:hypothetical protein
MTVLRPPRSHCKEYPLGNARKANCMPVSYILTGLNVVHIVAPEAQERLLKPSECFLQPI